jgi:hypothetical protein
MLRYDPGFINVLSDTASMLQVVFKSVYNARVHYSIEHGVSATHNVPEYKLFGENNAKTLALLTACGYLTNGPAVGSRYFNGTTDRMDRSSAGNLTAHALTISMWVNMTGIPASGNGYLMAIHDAGNTNYGIVISYDNTRVSFVVRGTSSYMNHYCDGSGGGQTFPIVNTGWTHVLVTWDGVFDASHVHCYRNGVERLGGNSNTTGETAHTGSWSIGGRIMDDTRNALGNISHFRVFDRVLDSSEINLEANGELTTSSGLICWYQGTTSSLADSKDGVNWTLDGTTHQTGAGKGPPIIAS